MWHPKEMLSPKAGVAGVLSRAWGDHSYLWLSDVLHKGTEHVEGHRGTGLCRFCWAAAQLSSSPPQLSGAVCGPRGLQAGGNQQAY